VLTPKAEAEGMISLISRLFHLGGCICLLLHRVDVLLLGVIKHKVILLVSRPS
jgi:hypothetical protein